MNNFIYFKFLVIIFTIISFPNLLLAQDRPTRPLTLFISGLEANEVKKIDAILALEPGAAAKGPVTILSKLGEPICRAHLGSRGNNWLFKNLECSFSDEVLSEVMLLQKRKWGVINHGIAKVSYKNGLTLGILVHVGYEDVELSTSVVSLEDVASLYGTFPIWELPNISSTQPVLPLFNVLEK
jgi:hypothetical protein